MELPIANVYQQSPRDERSTQWGPFNFSEFVLDTDTSIITGGPPIATNVRPWEIPGGYIAHVRHYAVKLRPGALQLVTFWQIDIRDKDNDILLTLVDGRDGAADEILVSHGPLDALLVGGQHFMTLNCNFDAGVAGNQASLNVQSMLMPRGNIAGF